MLVDTIECKDVLDYLKGLPDSCVDLIVTSPPYNKGYWSKNRNINNGPYTKSRHIDYGCFDDKMLPQDYEAWQVAILKECCRVIKETGSIFYNHIDILSEHLTIHPLWVYGFPLKQIIIWNKKNTPKIDKSYFFPITEYVFWIKKNLTSRPFFNRKNCSEMKSIWTFSPDTKNPHPAPFPVEFAENIILACSQRGGLVLDPFMGSGSVAVASKKLGRHFIGCELNPEYVAMANRRLSKHFLEPWELNMLM